MVNQWFLDLRDSLRRGGAADVAAVLSVTVSVQGLIVASQFLIAFMVKPEQLGLIRWLEASFAVALLATSCGMPSISFRLAALHTGTEGRIDLVARATMLTSLAVALVLLGSLVVYSTFRSMATGPDWATLLAMAGALWPANIARVGVAIVQGGQLSQRLWARLLAFSGAAVLALCTLTWQFGVEGWVVGRYGVELGLAALVVHALLPSGARPGHVLRQRLHDLRGLLWMGTTANFAFLIRAVSDNLPILLLRASLGTSEELGWFGFASLAIFMPTLLLSVLVQAQLPGLVQSVGDAPGFSRSLSGLQRRLLYGAAAGACLIFAFALLVSWRLLFSAYSAAVWPLCILGASLPLRALILTAGAAAVAHGRYAISSILAIVEMIVVSCFAWSGHGSGATDMSLAVLGASALSVIPALALTQSCRNTGK